MNILKSLLCTALLSTGLLANAAVGFQLDTSTAVDLTVTTSTGSSNETIYTIVTTGTDPHIISTGIESDCNYGDADLKFQYTTSEDIADVQIFFMAPDLSESKSTHLSGFMTARTAWGTASTNIANQKSNYTWGAKGDKLRFDFGNKAGVTIKIRYFGIYGTETVSEANKTKESNNLARYLGATYPANIDNVKVTTDKVIITGTAVSPGKLSEIRMNGAVLPMTNYSDVATISDAGAFSIEVPRYTTLSDGYKYDRLLSRWAIVDNSHNLQSHAHYADDVAAIRHATPGVLQSKKGLGGITNQSISDITSDNLGIHSVTMNLFLNEFVSITPRDGYVEHEYCGRTYYINAGKQAYNDNVLKTLEKNGVVVAGIILMAPTGGDPWFASTICHPEYVKFSNTHYTMPNMSDVDAIHVYAAAIDYLANRYSQDGNGRIHHWVIHNEVDQHRSWTNMGESPQLLRLVDTYEKSMRLVSNIVRQYDPNAYVLASFTSSWSATHGDGGFSAKSILERIVNYSDIEGDYRWGIAAHPYPIDFFKPKFWEADTRATYDENSEFSTFKNIEVISDWVLRREHYYKNEEKRILFFTENGVNSLSNTTTELANQAAGAAWAWKKSKANAGVDAIMWHNWADNASEGVNLGLRDSNKAAKPAW